MKDVLNSGTAFSQALENSQEQDGAPGLIATTL